MTRLADELRAVLGAREHHSAPRFEPSPAAIEEEAANRLYGERTGTVHASPASPPLPQDDGPASGVESSPEAATSLVDGAQQQPVV